MKIKKFIGRIRLLVYLLIMMNIGFLMMASAKPPVIVNNAGYQLIINSDKGTIESFKVTSGGGSDELLIPTHGQLPLFKVEFLSGVGTYQLVTSLEAKKVSVNKTVQSNVETIVIDYEGIGELNLNARVTVRCPSDKPLTYWNLELDNQTKMWVGHTQFPVVEVPFDRNPTEENRSHILTSLYDGVLVGPVQPSMVAGGWRARRRNTVPTWRSPNYPRECTVQMMAYYTPHAGLYLACEDPKGNPKLVAPLLEDNGVTMGLGHFPATQGPDKSKMPYEVVLGTFRGDWYAAAEIYRDWATKQDFVGKKLAERTNYPEWLQKPVVGVAFPMRGQGDWDPPAALNPEYTPATNALPYLDKLAKAFDAPLMPIVFNWENAGPWVQPGAFPPVGGEASMRSFLKKSKAKGWHPVLYGNGVNWVVGQKNTGYDGMLYFKTHGGDSAIVHTWAGVSKASTGGWRSLYNTCVATEPARRMILEMTRGMARLGPSVIQQFDQGVGAATCYAPNHGHPPVPGPWMTASFSSLLKEDNEVARSLDPKVAVSSEGAAPEIFMHDFDFWDARTGGGGQLMSPLYSFLYHEYINGHSGFYTNSVNDEALLASVARALVSGYFINLTLRDKGLVGYDWNQLWNRAIPDQQAILDWTKRATKFRNGIGRDYLIFGRMLRPWQVNNVIARDFGYGKEPLVQSGTWEAPDKRTAVVLANYANSDQSPRVALEGRGKKKIIIYNDDKIQRLEIDLPSVIDVKMSPRSLGLVEVLQ